MIPSSGFDPASIAPSTLSHYLPMTTYIIPMNLILQMNFPRFRGERAATVIQPKRRAGSQFSIYVVAGFNSNHCALLLPCVSGTWKLLAEWYPLLRSLLFTVYRSNSVCGFFKEIPLFIVSLHLMKSLPIVVYSFTCFTNNKLKHNSLLEPHGSH